MAPPRDPYSTLGLPRDASIGEVKRAYRRLAKANHPDAAGEDALPRFLAIQAAYDTIVAPIEGSNGTGAPGGRPGPRPGAPSGPWAADPDRADATHRAYGGRARRSRAGSAGPRRQRPPGPAGSGPQAADADPATPSGGGRRAPKRATLGSTSYDGVDAEPFEPDWGGASWYGTTSGTYWTLNPKEYADPRKHGPEYQARARRAAAGGAPPAGETAPPDAARADVDPAVAAPPTSEPPPTRATHTTASWWTATAGGQASTSEPARSRASEPTSSAPPTSPPRSVPAASAAAPTLPTTADLWRWLAEDPPRWVVRFGRAVAGWLPIALAVGWLAGELTGCGRFAADCDPSAIGLTWLVQAIGFVVLLVVPRLAAVLTVAALVMVAAAIPATVILTVGGGPPTGDPTGPAPAGLADLSALLLGLALAAGWAIGLALGIQRLVLGPPRPVS